MSIQTEIDRINQNVANTYSVLNQMGADMPTEQNTDNLSETAQSIKVVRYNKQTLTDNEKTQARENIGAEKEGTANELRDYFFDVEEKTISWDGNTEGVPSVGSGTSISYRISDEPFRAVDFFKENVAITYENGTTIVVSNAIIPTETNGMWNASTAYGVAGVFDSDLAGRPVGIYVTPYNFSECGMPLSIGPFLRKKLKTECLPEHNHEEYASKTSVENLSKEVENQRGALNECLREIPDEYVTNKELEQALSDVSDMPVVDSVEEMTDAKKKYVLKSTGEIWACVKKTVTVYPFTNLADPTDEDWLINHRLNSSSKPVELNGCSVSNFIDGAKSGDTLRIKGCGDLRTQGNGKICVYNSSSTPVMGGYTANDYAEVQQVTSIKSKISYDSATDTNTFVLFTQGNGVLLSSLFSQVRLSFESLSTSIIVTLNEEITEGEEVTINDWSGTGRYFGSESVEIVKSVEEMIDTNKKYVLEETGTIWKYGAIASDNAVTSYTNQIPLSTDKDGNPYNGGLGYKNNTRYNSSFLEKDQANAFVTGYIPVKGGDTVYLSYGILSGNDGAFNSSFWQEDLASATTRVHGFTPYNWANNNVSSFAPYNISDGGVVLSFTVPVMSTPIAYMTLSLIGSGENAIVTVNEPITESSGTKTDWYDTKIPYSSSSNEALTGLEQRVSKVETTVQELKENQGSNTGTTAEIAIPNYWKTAVDALEPRILELQDMYGPDAFQLMFGADVHGTNGYTNTNGAGTSVTKNIGTVVEYTTDKYHIPGVLFAGDIHSQGSHTNVTNVDTEYDNLWKYILNYISIQKLLMGAGNHDGAYGAPVDGVYYLKDIGNKRLYNYLFRKQALDRNRKFGKDGTYFYVDMPPNARVIMLNCHTDGDGSNDANGDAVYNSMKVSVYGTEQLAWLKEVLLSTPEGTKIIVSAHQPIANSKDGALLAGMLNAYNNRGTYKNSITITDDYWGKGVTDTTYTKVSVDVDFTNAKGKVKCYLHGHIHKDTHDNTTHTFASISITTAGADVRDAVPQERVVGTATETALDIVTITSDYIYCTRLGAGSGTPNENGIYERVIAI